MSRIDSATSRKLGTCVKANAHYQCQECGSTEYIQAHHQIPNDDSSLMVLCGECHSNKHPNVPKALFFTKSQQPYWDNISASSLAKSWGTCSRTIIRTACRLEIEQGTLSKENRRLLKRGIRKLREYQLKLTKLKYGNSSRPPGECVGHHISFIPEALERITRYLATNSDEAQTLSALVDKAVWEYLERQVIVNGYHNS